MTSGVPEAVAGEAGAPAWAQQAVVYGLVPHNAGSCGLRSVTAALPYLQSLGVNAIWLSPVFPSPTGGHGYDVCDYFEVRPAYGTKADLKELVQQAHARGIRVLLDFVPNHTSFQHPYFLEAERHGPGSRYYHYYDRDADGNPTHYFNWTDLPNLDYNNPQVRQWMLSAFVYWIREFDVDGYRVDAAWGIRQRSPDFWPEWRQELKRIKPDLLLLAEASARDPYYFSDGFDAAYDWTSEVGHWAWEKVFEDPALLTGRLHAALTNQGAGYHPEALIFRFLNNNDTGARFVTRYGLGMTRVAAALLLTLPGIPCLYLGDEVGAEFEPYREAGPIAWEDRHGLRNWYRRLIALRRSLPALHSRAWRPVELVATDRVYGYLRLAAPGEPAALVLLNFSAQEAMVELCWPADMVGPSTPGVVMDALSEVAVGPAGAERAHIPLPAWGVRVLVQAES